MTQAYPPPGQPYQQQPPAPPAKKPIFKKWWFWVGLVVVLIIIAGVAGGNGSSNSDSPAAATSAAVGESAPADGGTVETTEAAPEPADDPLSDGDWTASDVQLENSQFGTSVTARVTNTSDGPLTGLFTITVFDANGGRIGNFSGSANTVEAGDTQTVTFVGTTQTLEGDPATFTYEFQDDGSF